MISAPGHKSRDLKTWHAKIDLHKALTSLTLNTLMNRISICTPDPLGRQQWSTSLILLRLNEVNPQSHVWVYSGNIQKAQMGVRIRCLQTFSRIDVWRIQCIYKILPRLYQKMCILIVKQIHLYSIFHFSRSLPEGFITVSRLVCGLPTFYCGGGKKGIIHNTSLLIMYKQYLLGLRKDLFLINTEWKEYKNNLNNVSHCFSSIWITKYKTFCLPLIRLTNKDVDME